MAPRSSQNKRDVIPEKVKELRKLNPSITMMVVAKGTLDAATAKAKDLEAMVEKAKLDYDPWVDPGLMSSANQIEKERSNQDRWMML